VKQNTATIGTVCFLTLSNSSTKNFGRVGSYKEEIR